MIELRVLGALELRDTEDGHAVRSVLAQPKRLALLCYLALARPHGFHQRETLLGLFWPETDPERGRKALNQALSYLRRGLGEGVILTRNAGEVGVDPEQLWCDAAAFEERLETGEVAEALELYEGELLPGFYLTGCGSFERWVEGERERLRRAAVEAALQLADAREAEGNGVAAVHRARQATSWAPWDEGVLRRLLELLAGAGDVAGALRAYDGFAARLDEELQARPSSETRALAEGLRAGTPSPGGISEGVHHQSGATPAGARGPGAEDDQFRTERGDVARFPRSAGGARRARAGRLRVAAALLALLTGLAVAATFLNSAGESRTPAEAADASPAPPDLDPKRVLVAPLWNRTGEAEMEVIGSLASDWVAQGLARAGGLTVVSPLDVLQESVLDDVTTGEEPERWFGLAQRTGAGTLVEGSYARQGDALVFEVHLLDVASGELRHALEPVMGSLARVLDSVEGLRRRIIAAVATHLDPGLGPWTGATSGLPPTPEAYRLFSEGMALFLDARDAPSNFRKAAKRFLEAARADSGFAAPVLWAAWAHGNAGDRDAAQSLVNSLHAIRDRLPPQERAAVDHLRARLARDHEGAYRASRRLLALAPASEWRHKLTADALQVGRPREALAVLLELRREGAISTTWPTHVRRFAAARHRLGDHQEELEDVHRLEELLTRVWGLPPDDPDWEAARLAKARALGALGRHEKLAELIGRPEDLSFRWHLLALGLGELRAHGHETAAARLLGSYLPAGTEIVLSDSALARTLERPWLEDNDVEAVLSMGGRFEAARRVVELILSAADPDTWIASSARAWLGVLAARRGEPEEARRIERLLEEASPWASQPGLDEFPKVYKAAIRAQLGERDAAVGLLREAVHADGCWYCLYRLHAYWWFEPLRGYAPFETLLEPRG